MIRFLNGPAMGKTLMLKRAPRFLRVVQGNDGEFDALDQVDDSPRDDERIVVYEIKGKPAMVHLNMGRKGGGWYPVAEYLIVPEQPEDAKVRSTPAWQAWCLARASV